MLDRRRPTSRRRSQTGATGLCDRPTSGASLRLAESDCSISRRQSPDAGAPLHAWQSGHRPPNVLGDVLAVIGDQQNIITGPDLCEGRCQRGDNVIGPAHVGPKSNGPSACLANGVPHLLGAFLVAMVTDSHSCPQISKDRRRGGADARRCSRDQCDFAC